MLQHATLDKLTTLKFTGMAAVLADQMAMANMHELSFEERLGLLVDCEAAERESRRLTSRLRDARLRQNTALKDIDLRGLFTDPMRPAERPDRRDFGQEAPNNAGATVNALANGCKSDNSPEDPSYGAGSQALNADGALRMNRHERILRRVQRFHASI